MDYSDIDFIHPLTTLPQRPHCAPQKCSTSHQEARLPINKMVTMQNPDKIWMLFIFWRRQMRRKRRGFFAKGNDVKIDFNLSIGEGLNSYWK